MSPRQFPPNVYLLTAVGTPSDDSDEVDLEGKTNANRARWGRPLKMLPDVSCPMFRPVSEIRVWLGNEEQS
jgi:hypothetical protein